MPDNGMFHICSNTWLSYVPGLSSLNSSELVNFKLSFLSSIYSGILSGIVTGLIVGLVIYVFQKGYEKRQQKASLEREASIFKEKARVFIGKSGSYQLTNLEKAPEYIELVLGLIESSPLDLWKEHLPPQRDLIIQLREFQNIYFKFQLAGSHLDSAIRTIIRKYNASRNSISVNDNYIYGYYSGKLEDMEDDDILAWLDISKGAQSWISAGHSELKKDKDVRLLENKYLLEKKALKIAVVELKDYLGVSH